MPAELHPELEAALREWRKCAHHVGSTEPWQLSFRAKDALIAACDKHLPQLSLRERVEALLPSTSTLYGWSVGPPEGGGNVRPLYRGFWVRHYNEVLGYSISVFLAENNPHTPEEIVAALKVLAARGEEP